MRADNHQMLQPLFVSTLAKGVKYDSEDTGLGWKTDAKVDGKATALPTRARWTGRSKKRASTPHPLSVARSRGGLMLELVTVSLLNGVVYGLLLFMLSSGLTLIFSMMGVLNFAHASVFMLGAYLSFQSGRWVGFWPALVIAPLACALVGAAIERYGLRRVHPNGHVAEILFTFGLAYVIEEVVTMIWGRNAVANNVPAVIDFPLFTVFGSTFPAYKGLMMAISIAMFVFLYLGAQEDAHRARDPGRR
jgi:hypothetical protein